MSASQNGGKSKMQEAWRGVRSDVTKSFSCNVVLFFSFSLLEAHIGYGFAVVETSRNEIMGRKGGAKQQKKSHVERS